MQICLESLAKEVGEKGERSIDNCLRVTDTSEPVMLALQWEQGTHTT
jgi:hypothetical protein